MKKTYLSPKTEVKESRIQGKGLFARELIYKGEIVAVKGGWIFDQSKLKQLQLDLGPAEIQVSESLYIGPLTTEDREDAMMYLNHSCDANVGYRGQIVFVSMRDIEPDEELTHDWATADDQEYEIKCNCGSSECREIVTGQDWRKKDLQTKYKGYFAWFLQNKIDSMKDS